MAVLPGRSHRRGGAIAPLAAVLLIVLAITSGCAMVGAIGSHAGPAGSHAAASPVAATDEGRASGLADAYATALREGHIKAAWDLLAPEAREQLGGLTAYTAERTAFLETAEHEVTVGQPTQDPGLLATYTHDIAGGDIDLRRAWLVELDYPALGKEGASWDQLVAAPDRAGDWHLWWVR